MSRNCSEILSLYCIAEESTQPENKIGLVNEKALVQYSNLGRQYHLVLCDSRFYDSSNKIGQKAKYVSEVYLILVETFSL